MDGAPHQHHHMQQQQRYPPQGGAPMQPMMQNRVVLPLPQAPQPVGGLLLPGPNEPLFLPPGTATLEDDLDSAYPFLFLFACRPAVLTALLL